MKAWIRKNVDAVVHMIYPKVCVQCGWDLFEDENCICLKCQMTLPTAAPTLNHPQILQLFYDDGIGFHEQQNLFAIIHYVTRIIFGKIRNVLWWFCGGI